jgi:hypothetical protein
LSDELAKHGTNLPDGATGNQIMSAIRLMDSPIIEALVKKSAPEALELWHLYSEHISQVHANGGKGQGQKRVAYHPLLLNWAIAFLACTSSRVYGEVAKKMMLSHISHVYRKTAKLISTQRDKAFGLHINTIRSISEHARREQWTHHQRIGALEQDSANLNATIKHDYLSNTPKGGDQTHRLATLSQMYQTMARKVRDAQELENENKGGATAADRPTSILENIPLAEEHLVFKWVSIDPDVKCSDIVASINVKKVSASVITSMMISLRDMLLMFGLEMRMATSDAAGCNWVSFWDTLSMMTMRLCSTSVRKVCIITFAIFARIGTAWLTYAMDKTDRTAWRMQSSNRLAYCKL